MKYTIGKIARALSISTQCVRHYENMGIIDAERDENNQYRTYTTSDVKTLFQTCMYRSMGFSLKDIKSMLSECNMDEVSVLFEKRIEDVDQQIEKLMALRHELVDYKNGFKQISKNLNQVSIIDGDFSFYLVLKNGYGDDIPNDEDDILIECEQHAPYVRPASLVKTESVYGSDEDVHFTYGLSMSPAFVKSIGKEDSLKNYQVFIRKQYAKMNIEVKDSSDYANHLKRFVDEIRKVGYEPSDTIYGVMRFISLHDGETDVYEYITEVVKT